MLIEFRVANYRSIGEEQVLSLVPASKQKEHSENIIHDEIEGRLHPIMTLHTIKGIKCN